VSRFLQHPDAPLLLPFIIAKEKKGRVGEFRLEVSSALTIQGLEPVALALEVVCPHAACQYTPSRVRPFQRREGDQKRSPNTAQAGSIYFAACGKHTKSCSKGDGASAEYAAVVAELEAKYPVNVHRYPREPTASEILRALQRDGLDVVDRSSNYVVPLKELLDHYNLK
jgi:hypothetical protein